MNKDQFYTDSFEDKKDVGIGIRYDKSNPIIYPVTLRNMNRKDKVVYSNEEAFIHLCCNDSRPLVKQLTVGRLVENKNIIPGIITPELFISEDSEKFLFLYGRYSRYGMEVLYDISEIPNVVIEAFDVINNTIDSERAKMYKTQQKELEKAKKGNTNKSTRKSLPK